MVQSVKFNGYKSFAPGVEHEIDLSPYSNENGKAVERL